MKSGAQVQPVARGVGFVAGQVAVEGEVPQPAGEGDGQSGEVEPGGVATPVLGGQVACAARLQFLDLVLDVGLGAVPLVEPLGLPGGVLVACAPWRQIGSSCSSTWSPGGAGVRRARTRMSAGQPARPSP